MKSWLRIALIACATNVLIPGMPIMADGCGDCYEQSCACKLAPEWAIGGLAVVAIAAVLLQNNDSGHSH